MSQMENPTLWSLVSWAKLFKNYMKLPSTSIYKVYMNYKWISYLDLSSIPKIPHHVYANALKLEKSEIQNTSVSEHLEINLWFPIWK